MDELGVRMAGVPAQRRAVQDPEPTVPRLEALATRVLSGDVILPKFQRKFVWSRQQVLDLLDSVARNHPIGDAAPSEPDRRVTTRLRTGAEAVGLRFLDHVVAAEGEWRRVTADP